MKAMIISVGGTEEPIVKTIQEQQPDFVVFFTSQQSVDLVGPIKSKLKASGINISDYKVICDDAEDLLQCYSRAMQCVDKIGQEGIGREDVIVDYTGGTKTMTAALALATIGHGFHFSYVGGRQRNKGGLGVVESGKEIIRKGINPWQIFAVDQKRRISILVSNYHYEGALAIVESVVEELQPPSRLVWSALGSILTGYMRWDSFDHRTAIRELQKGLDKIEPLKSAGALERGLEEFVERTREAYLHLAQMSSQTRGFQTLHIALVGDLVSNAGRRAAQNRFDDAVARLYRAMEMIGQLAFREATGCDTSDVNPECLPQSIREELVRQHTSPLDQKVKLPLFSTFRVLVELKHPTGMRFIQHSEELKKILSARNNSILAHGMIPVARETYEKFHRLLLECFPISPLAEFPALKWE